MKYMVFVSRLIKAVAVGLVFSILLSLCGFGVQCEDITERVLRLHILAASNSEEDQALKLKVRDAVLEASHGLLDRAASSEEAAACLERQLPVIVRAAQQCVYDNGETDAVSAKLCEMYFPTRQYETVTLPAGTYRALRITIGKGEGQNWWCVVFPPMCLGGAVKEQALAEVLTDSEAEIVQNPQQYAVRLKVLEWWNGLFAQ